MGADGLTREDLLSLRRLARMSGFMAIPLEQEDRFLAMGFLERTRGDGVRLTEAGRARAKAAPSGPDEEPEERRKLWGRIRNRLLVSTT